VDRWCFFCFKSIFSLSNVHQIISFFWWTLIYSTRKDPCVQNIRDSRKFKAWLQSQNTSHWGVLYIIDKVLKCRCPKWPRMSHLDIYSPSYGQKNGRGSNWQFDSRPLKLGNRSESDVCRRSATWCWKALKESYKIVLELVPIRGLSKELWMLKVPGVQTRTVSRLLLESLGKKCHSDVASAESCREYYMGEGGGFPESGPWWIKWVQGCPWFVPTPNGYRMSSNQLVGWF
jgi:hypothetical protein